MAACIVQGDVVVVTAIVVVIAALPGIMFPSLSLGLRAQPVLNNLPNSNLGNACASVLKTTSVKGKTSSGPKSK